MPTCFPRRLTASRRTARFAASVLALTLTTAGLFAGATPAAATSACLTDTAGADDINATQKDLNEFCQSVGNDGGLAGCLATDANLTWTWDDTGWTGSNTGDACALYDTDGDKKANFALCASVQANPAVQSTASPKFYSCDDSKALNCGGSGTITAGSACRVSNVADAFPGAHGNGNVCNGSSCSTRDTQAQCCVKKTDFPSNTTPELLDVCSYPSSSPSSSPSECVKAVLCTNDTECSALTDGCNVGSCASDGLTKRCVATPKSNGTSCNDGNACTQADTCQSGTCTGGTAVVCSAADQCHVAGTCDASTGQCSSLAAPNGTTCNDGNACTQTDTCSSGTCSGSNPVVCSASDQCHAAGTCNAATGQCSNPAAANGTSCNDGNACTQIDTCQGGSCGGGSPVVCSASDQCHVAGSCDAATGQCSNPVAANGTGCSDSNACTTNDTCQGGTCSAGAAVVCTASDQCHVAGACDPGSGQCSNPIATNGTSCNDSNVCTQTDTCQNGTCTGGNGVTCTARDQCHSAGTCDPGTGTCSNPSKANGSSCNDGNACTRTDTCQSGSCSGGNVLVCTALDQCHVPGTCNTSTGACSNPNATDGTTCTDASACTVSDTCQSGTCVGGNGPSTEPGCKIDTGGADDAVGQKDLSKFCVNHATTCTGTIFTWQWDDTAWTGGNTGDACALYDTDGDGFANKALCVTVTGSPATQAAQSPRFYTCGNTKQFNCTGAALAAAPGTSCAATGGATDPFAALSRKSNKCAGGACLAKDAQAQCCVGTASLPATATLIDVCSYPSQSPNSDPSECVKTVFCTSNADCSVTNAEGTCSGTCTSVGGVNQCVF